MKRDITVVGIDIAKRVFHLVGMDERGKIVMRKRCGRGEVLPLMANLGADHHWDGSMWWRPLLGAALAGAGACGQTDGSSVCEALRQVKQK